LKKQTLNIEDVADSLDWRDKNVVNAVKDQGQCGSCWAFSTVGTVESRWAIKSGTLLSLSEQELVDCEHLDENAGCDGGLMDDAFTWLETHSLELETAYPYKATDGKCKYSKSKGKVGVAKYVDLEQSDSALITALQEGPVAVGVAAND